MNQTAPTVVLLERWHAGDESALHTMLEQELPWIRARVESRLGSFLKQLGDAEDYVQAAMLQILKHGPRFRVSDRGHFRRLLAVLVENTIRQEHRFHRRERRDVDRVQALPRDSVLDLDPPRRGVTRPSAVVAKQEEAAWLRLAMDLLPSTDGQIVRMRTWDGLAFGEIGAAVELTEGAARMRFQRALGRMARNFVQLRSGQLAAILDERS